MFWPISASSFDACPDVSFRLVAAWICTGVPLFFAAALTPSFIAAKNGLSRPLIITPTGWSLPPLDAWLPPLSPPPQAAADSESAAPTVSAITLRVLLILPSPWCSLRSSEHNRHTFVQSQQKSAEVGQKCYPRRMAANGDRRRHTAGAGRLLELVRTGVADTRIALTRESGLARATVNDRLDLLVDAGLIATNGSAASTGGRRGGPFAFNEPSGVVFVADFGASSVGLAVCDLSANLLAHERHEIDIAGGPEPNLAIVHDRMAEGLALAGRSTADVIAVTIGVPGPVQADPPRVVSPPIMTGWDGVVIPDALTLPLPVPILVGKDTNLMALGEHRASFPEEEHILVIKVGTGFGSGIICARALHQGAVGAAGDIGHIPVPGVEEPGVSGKIGCVEAKASGWALARDLRALGHDVQGSRDVVAMIRAREPDAMRLVNESAKLLGIAIADAVNVLNPSTVVLGGDIANAHEHLLSHVREVVYTRSLALATRSLDIVLSELGDRAGVLGGAYLAIEHRLRPDALDHELERRIAAGTALNAWT